MDTRFTTRFAGVEDPAEVDHKWDQWVGCERGRVPRGVFLSWNIVVARRTDPDLSSFASPCFVDVGTTKSYVL